MADVEPQAYGAKPDEAAALRKKADILKASYLQPISERLAAGDKDAQADYDRVQQTPAWMIGHQMADHYAAQGNAEVARQLKGIANLVKVQDEESQTEAQKKNFDASRGTVLGVGTDAAVIANNIWKSYSDAASFGLAPIVREGVGRVVAAAGGPSLEKQRQADETLGGEATRTDLGAFVQAGGQAVAGAAGLTGNPMKLAGKILPKGLERAGKFVAGGARMAAASAETVLGHAGSTLLADALYGSPEGSHLPGRSWEILKQAPAEVANAAVMGVFGEALGAIGGGITTRLVGKWAPAVQLGQALKSIPLGQRLAVRTAQGLGSAVEMFGFTAIPHVDEHGKISLPWLDAFSEDKERRRRGLIEILAGATAFGVKGFAKGRYEPHVSQKNLPTEGPAVARGDSPLPHSGHYVAAEDAGKGIHLAIARASTGGGLTSLPPEIQIAVKSSAADAVDALMKNADGDAGLMASMLNIVKAREHMGMEPKGTWEKIASRADEQFGAEQKQKELEQIQKSAEKDQAAEVARVDKQSPTDVGFPIEPGMGADTKQKAAMLGQLFATEAAAKSKAPFKPRAFPGGTQRDIADTGKKLEINVSADKREPKWVGAEVIGRSFFGTGKEQGRLKAVHVKTDFGDGWFDATHIRRGLVREPTAKKDEVEKASDVKGQRKLKLKEEAKPKAPAEAKAAADKAVAAVPAEKIAAAKGEPKAGETRVATKEDLLKVAKYAGEEKRKAERAARTDTKTGLGNELAWKESLAKLPGSSEKVLRIDGTNSSAANHESVGGHPNGDKVFEGYGKKMQEAREKSGAKVSLFRVSGGDEFGAKGAPNELRKFKAQLSKDNKVGETALNGKKYEHRLIAGDVRDTNALADKSQQLRHASYRAQAEEAGLGVTRKEAAGAVPNKAPSKGPAVPSDFIEKQRSIRAKAKEKRAETLTARVAVAREGLKGSGLPLEKVTHETLYHAQIDRKKVYGENGWRKVRWQDVLDARESGDADRIAWTENAAKLANVTEPKKQEPVPATEGPPSPEAAGAPTPASETPNTPLIKTMGPTADYLAAIKSKGVDVATVESEADYIRTELRTAEEAGRDGDARRWLKALDVVTRVIADKKGTAKTDSPPERNAVDPEMLSGEEIVRRAVTSAKNEVSLLNAAYGQEATRSGKPISEKQRARIKEQEAEVKNLEKLAKLVKKKGAGAPSVVTKLPAPDVGENVIVRLDDGRAVSGVVRESKSVAKGEGLGRRLLIVKEDGTTERVRLSDVADIAPMDVMSHNFANPVEVSKGTFLSWFAGRRPSDTPGYEASVKLKSDFSEDPRSKGAERRRAILAGAATTEQAKREATSRARRVTYGKLRSDDYEIEAQAFLAPANARNEMKAKTTPDAKGHEALLQRRSPRVVADARELNYETHPIHWFDPDTKLRTEAELAELAKHTGKDGEQAARDLANYYHFREKADFERAREAIADTLDATSRRMGRGFFVVSGDVDTLDKGGHVHIRQQAISEQGNYGKPELLVVDKNPESGNFRIRALSVMETVEAYHKDPGLREAVQKYTNDRHAEKMARADEQTRMQVVEFAGHQAKNALEAIEGFLYGDRDSLPAGELFDMARAFAKEHPRPEPGTKEDKTWEDLARAQIDGTAEGASSIYGRATELALAFRDPVTGEPLEWKPTEGGGEVAPVEGSRVRLLSVLPGAPPPGTWKALGAVGRGAEKGMRAVTDVTDSLSAAALDPIRDFLFRPETTGLTQTYGDKAWFKRWVKAARYAETKLIPGGSEGSSEMRTILNQSEGHKAALEEKAEKALKEMSKIGQRMAEALRDHTMGKTWKELTGVKDLFNELLDSFKAEGVFDGSEADRFRDIYIPYNKFEWTAAEIADRRKNLYAERRRLSADGKETKRLDSEIELLDEIVTKHGAELSPSRIVVGPISLRKYHDSSSATLWRKGYTKRRGFESWDDAVKAGLDVSNPLDLVRQGLFDEINYLTRLRLFKELAQNKRMVMDSEKAPNHWVTVDKAATSGHDVWDLLDGKKVLPELIDQLHNADPKYDPVKYWMNYAHLAMKAGAVMYNPTPVVNNLIGNPLILMTAGMPGWKVPNYFRAGLELWAADPLRPGWMQALARNGKYGSQRELYVRQGWVNRSTDLTREIEALFSSDRGLNAYARNGFEIQDRDADEGAFHKMVGLATGAARWSGTRIKHFWGLVDAGARVALYEHHLASGMEPKAAINDVNDWFDVQHLPAAWEALRSGPIAMLPGVGALSFSSYPVAMARNSKKILSRGPLAWAQMAAFAYAVKTVAGLVYGKSKEEMDQLIDAATPRTGSRFFDALNRSTSLVVPWQHGPAVKSMVKYSPHDAVLDLVPGVRPLAMGGHDERGRVPSDALYDYLGRSVLSGPYAEWFLDHDNLTGSTVRDRYDSMWDFLRQRQGLPIPVPFAQFVARLMVKGDAMRRAEGVNGSQAVARAPVFLPGRRDRAPGASVYKYNENDAWANLFGLTPQQPNAIRRYEEDATNSGLVQKKDGDWIPTVDRDGPGRDEARAIASKLNLADDFTRGMRLSESLIWLGKAVANNDTEQIAELKKVISKMAPSDSSYRSAIKALVWYNERGRAYDIASLGIQLGVRPARERRIVKGGGDVTLPTDDE